MVVPLTFRDSEGYPYQKDGAEVFYARARGQNCELYFEKGDPEIYGYPLKVFHQKIWETNLFRKLDRSLLVKICKVLKRKARKALLDNGTALELSRKANKRLKYYLAKFRKAASEQK